MKFCPKKYYEVNNKTSTHYASLEDIKKFHGNNFFNQFKEFIKHKQLTKFGEDEGYYYVDYNHAARQTDSFLNPIG